MKGSVTVKKDIVKQVMDGIKQATKKEVLIGIPATEAARKSDAGGNINNAMLGLVHEYGDPLKRIPARPWLRPAIDSIRPAATAQLKRGLEQALAGKGRPEAAERALNAVGKMGVAAAKNRIRNKIAPGLAKATLQARLARKQGSGVRINKGAKAELALRASDPSVGRSAEFTTPLIDTGKMIRAINYEVRDKK
jgi:hypothetical protein